VPFTGPVRPVIFLCPLRLPNSSEPVTLLTFSRSFVIIPALALVACKGSDNGPGPEPGAPAQIVLLNTQTLQAPANTDIPVPIQVSVRDANGIPLPNQTVSVVVAFGGGSISANSATTGADGTATLPTWRLGKTAVTQTLRVTLGTILSDINAQVQTAYDIVLRFYGPAMTGAQQAVFTNAANRIRGFITGDAANTSVNNLDLSTCSGQPNITETIDDVIIYAALVTKDGIGGVLASAGPCYIRSPNGLSLVGLMEFDQADFNDPNPNKQASLPDVITHEMLHVIGIGSLWKVKGFLVDSGSPNPRYSGPQGRQGCVDAGGTLACSSNVPVQETGGPGTADAHWRESTFDTELMTGIAENVGAMPLSRMSILSLADLGYVVNTAPFVKWEEINHVPLYSVDPLGQVRLVRKPQ
jgi:hypothetical protein